MQVECASSIGAAKTGSANTITTIIVINNKTPNTVYFITQLLNSVRLCLWIII